MLQAKLFDFESQWEILDDVQPKLNRSIYQKMILDKERYATEISLRGEVEFNKWFLQLVNEAIGEKTLANASRTIIDDLSAMLTDIAVNARKYEDWMREAQAVRRNILRD